MRNLSASGEPTGHVAATPAKLPRFFIQKHDATRLHYDLRLEMDGVLRSWAVPKGLPTVPGERSLAIEVEDHPLDYGNFEGTIPAGNYGAGAVMLWDRGFYTVGGGNPSRAWREGKIHFALAGKKLVGEWTLVRLRNQDSAKKNWLVIKVADSAAAPHEIDHDLSVLTDRTLDEIASGATASRSHRSPATRRAPLRKPAPHRVAAPSADAFVEPMKALATTSVPAGDWRLEIKFDGFRVLAILRNGAVSLWSRNRKELTASFPEIATSLTALRCADAVLDGEVVALDAEGRSSFQLMQRRDVEGAKAPLRYYVFDLLHLDGQSLLKKPLEQRCTQLERLFRNAPENLKLSPAFNVQPEELLAEVRAKGLEGIVAKRLGSLYEPGRRSGAWLKCRVTREQEFVIGGFTAPSGSRTHFGAILVGYYEGKKLHYAGKVGTGFDHDLLESLHERFIARPARATPFANLPLSKRSRFGAGMTAAEMRRVTWVRPELVCQVRFAEWTDDGMLRQPVFLGMREDKPAREVVRERLAKV